MCGICGYQAERLDALVLRRMNARLETRGPDEQGEYIGEGVALAIRRLQVIDPPGGSQPMTNEDGTLRLVYNGEIYNFRELRAELEARGHVFASAADTEVIVHGYEEWGAAVVDRLNGMFAFALWDAAAQAWLLARDRLGQKPLYYYHARGLFAFASQPAALLEHVDVPAELNAAALAAYLAFEYVPSPLCMFAGLGKLPPAHRMQVDAAGARIERYWTFPTRAEAEASFASGLDDDGWARQLRTRLGDAVERQLVADVPLGCFLSGGLDSSAIAVLMTERMRGQRLQTFSIGFADPSFDESAHATAVAQHLRTEHHVQIVDAAQLIDLLPTATTFMDEPLGDGSVLPTYALARFARRHVTVALSGDGGDELLGGYPTFFADRVADRYARLVPDWLHAAMAAAARRLPVSHRDMSADFKIKQFLRAARRPPHERHIGWVGSFLPHEIAELLVAGVAEHALASSPYEHALRELQASPGHDGLDALLHLYARFYLADDVLVKVDRTTMACGLEARSPFLDPELVRFCAAVPRRLKVHGARTKVLLRRAFAGDLPPHILKRPKKGFGIPVGSWLRGPLRPLLGDMLSEERLRAQGLFRPEPILRRVAEHFAGRADHRKQLWTLLAFQLWHACHLDRRC